MELLSPTLRLKGVNGIGLGEISCSVLIALGFCSGFKSSLFLFLNVIQLDPATLKYEVHL